MVQIIGSLLVLISLFQLNSCKLLPFSINSTAYAQTGLDGVDTPQGNCVLGGQDFNLNSSVKECRKGNGGGGLCCNAFTHCGPDFTPTPTPCDCQEFTPTSTRTPSPTPT